MRLVLNLMNLLFSTVTSKCYMLIVVHLCVQALKIPQVVTMQMHVVLNSVGKWIIDLALYIEAMVKIVNNLANNLKYKGIGLICKTLICV